MLTLAAEINPNPAEPGGLLDAQITVTTTSATGNLTLRLEWPAGVGSTPFTTGGGGCSGSCSVGEFLIWNLGSLGPGQTQTVGFNENVLSGTCDGTIIPFEIDLLEDGTVESSITPTIEIRAESPLSLLVDPLSDPVAAGDDLVYEIVYGNDGVDSAENVELAFPVPAGTVFLSATGGGVFSGGQVSWDLGSLAAQDGGRQRVTVGVGALPAGTLLEVDSAVLSGDIVFQPRESRATAVSRVGPEALELALEINPDPARPGSLVDAQVSVSNPSASATGSLTLRLFWPEGIGSTPFTTGGGGCSGSCSEGEYLQWTLGVLGAGASLTVGFNENLLSGTDSGEIIPFEFELLEGARPARARSHSLRVQADSPLSLAVDPLSDPVPPGDTLVYEVVYGNDGTASAENVVLTFPLPPGTQFLSATEGGVFSGGQVSWDLGTLAAQDGGRQRVAVGVGTLPTDTLLEVDAAVLSGDIVFQPRESRATAVSRIDDEALQLALEINPDPARPGSLVDAQVSVSNPRDSASGSLTLRLLWPEGIASTPFTTGGGGCSGSCSEGEYLQWTLGVLGAGASLTVGFNENLLSGTNSGEIIPFEFELLEGARPARNRSHSLRVQADSPLNLAVDPLSDPVPPGATLVYELFYGNRGNASVENASLSLPLPAGTSFLSATGGGTLVSGTVIWNLGTIAAHGGGRQQVTVEVDALSASTLLEVDSARVAGDVAFQMRESRAMATTRVDDEPLTLLVAVDFNPVDPGDLVAMDLNVGNPGSSSTGILTLRILWPEDVSSTPTVTGGGGCSGSCSEGEYLVWNLGSLGPGADLSVSFNESVLSGTDDGELIPFEIELIEGSLPARVRSPTVLVHPFEDNDDDTIADVLDFDDDNDGMPDWWEVLNGLDPLDPADADADPDMDGATNLEEFLAGTDPNLPSLIFEDDFESGDLSGWS
ncbi:MAG: hypothetical protein AAF560_17985 [Acidobacteriota bacterium]